MNDMTTLVEMHGIEKRFPGVHALKQARFELLPGEVHTLMGENGAGKSTLMKILCGVYRRDGGLVKIQGDDVNFTTPRAAQEAGVGIIHQELSLMHDLTVAQNIFIGREPRLPFGLLDEDALNRKTSHIFEWMNINIDPRAVVGNLTIAKQQIVEVAQALSYDSRILVMDEPTAALNANEVAELYFIIGCLKEKGVGIVYISHKMDEVKRISDRVTVMRDGKTIDTANADDLSINDIISMMVGRTIVDEALSIPSLDAEPVALEVRGLSRNRDFTDVSFSIKSGEILGFAGLMGAGRTEVARAIFGADPIDSGEIKVGGKKVVFKNPAEAVDAGIGYLSEDRKHIGLATGMSVRANISMASLARFSSAFGILDETTMSNQSNQYIEQFSIRTPNDQQEVGFLSGGNQQKVVIAKWLLRDCKILIFDEPTRGIDVGAKAEIYKLLNTLAQQGRAIVVISSDLPEVLRLSHRIAVMCEGKLTGFLPGGTSTSQEIMKLATQRNSNTNPTMWQGGKSQRGTQQYTENQIHYERSSHRVHTKSYWHSLVYLFY